MAVTTPLQSRFKPGAQQQSSPVHAIKEHKRMWLVFCLFVGSVALGMIGNVPESLDRVYHGHRSAPGLQAAPVQHAEVIKASKLHVESARAQLGDTELSTVPAKIALCTSIKWEQPEDMQEWVQYYQYVPAHSRCRAQTTRIATDASSFPE